MEYNISITIRVLSIRLHDFILLLLWQIDTSHRHTTVVLNQQVHIPSADAEQYVTTISFTLDRPSFFTFVIKTVIVSYH